MSQKLFLSIVAALFLICASPAHADSVTASGAGALPGTAQDLTSMNVTQILGVIPDPFGVDMFKINITDFTNFSAMTVDSGAFGIPDTELFLFNAAGFGVLGNDDIDGGNTFSCLPAAGPSNLCAPSLPTGVGPTSDGTYFLAITRSANSPIDGAANDLFTFPDSTDVVGPNSGVGAIADWDGGVFTSPDSDLQKFDIMLTGTAPVLAPEPSTWALLITGLVFILLRRKKLASQSENCRGGMSLGL